MGDQNRELPHHAAARMRCDYRHPEDDFFCNRFQVWYPSLDCAFRTRFRTSDGCLDCEQGRFNLKRHSRELDHPGTYPDRLLARR